MVGAKVSETLKMSVPTTTLSLRTHKACLFTQEAQKLDDATPSYANGHTQAHHNESRVRHAGRTKHLATSSTAWTPRPHTTPHIARRTHRARRTRRTHNRPFADCLSGRSEPMLSFGFFSSPPPPPLAPYPADLLDMLAWCLLLNCLGTNRTIFEPLQCKCVVLNTSNHYQFLVVQQ